MADLMPDWHRDSYGLHSSTELATTPAAEARSRRGELVLLANQDLAPMG